MWKNLDDTYQCALANRYIADCYIELGDFDNAISYTNAYLNLSKEIDNKLEQQRALVTLGRCFLNRADSLKDGSAVSKSLNSASQAFLSSIRRINDLTKIDSRELAEMRAVSLLNLGNFILHKVEFCRACL